MGMSSVSLEVEGEEGRGEEEVGITLLRALNARQESRLFMWAAGSLP